MKKDEALAIAINILVDFGNKVRTTGVIDDSCINEALIELEKLMLAQKRPVPVPPLQPYYRDHIWNFSFDEASEIFKR